MIRMIAVGVVVLIVAGLAWLLNVEGTVTLRIADYELRTGAGTAALMMLVFYAIVFYAFQLALFVARAPRRLADAFRRKPQAQSDPSPH